MTLPLTWDQMPLTAQQQTLMQQLAVYSGGEVPPATYSQTKQAFAWLVSLSALVEPARAGMATAIQFYRNEAQANFDAANP